MGEGAGGQRIAGGDEVVRFNATLFDQNGDILAHLPGYSSKSEIQKLNRHRRLEPRQNHRQLRQSMHVRVQYERSANPNPEGLAQFA
jgi:hypothetical protein